MTLTHWRILLRPRFSRPRVLTPGWVSYAQAVALFDALAGVQNVEIEHTQLERVTRGQRALEQIQRPVVARRLELRW